MKKCMNVLRAKVCQFWVRTQLPWLLGRTMCIKEVVEGLSQEALVSAQDLGGTSGGGEAETG